MNHFQVSNPFKKLRQAMASPPKNQRNGGHQTMTEISGAPSGAKLNLVGTRNHPTTMGALVLMINGRSPGSNRWRYCTKEKAMFCGDIP